MLISDSYRFVAGGASQRSLKPLSEYLLIISLSSAWLASSGLNDIVLLRYELCAEDWKSNSVSELIIAF